MIEANFVGQEMSLQYDGIISDSIRFLKIHFNFDEYWDGFEKTAVFSHNGEKFLVALCDGNSIYLGDNICYVPQEVIKAQSFSVSVFGNKDSTVITSSSEDVSVADSGVGKRIPRDPTPTAWSQMLEIENHTNDMVSELIERADSGEFDGKGVPEGGAIGQVLKKSSNADYDTEWGEISDAYTKEESDNRYVAKTITVNGKQLSGNIVLNHSDVGAYSKPQSGIPKSDLSSGIQLSLDKADTALQSHQSLNGYATEQWVENKGYLTQHQDISGKVDKVTGKALSTNDFTDYYKDKIDEKYEKPVGGIPKIDLASDVQTSLGKADTALQQHQDISEKTDKTYVDIELAKKQDKTDNSLDTNAKTVIGAINELNLLKGTYSKPQSGIPKSDLSSGIQSSLDKADTALQTHQDISGKADKTYVDTALVTKANVNDLSSVATSGSYNDLTNKPTTELIKTIVCTGEESAVNITTDENGNQFNLDGIFIRIITPKMTRTQDTASIYIRYDYATGYLKLICQSSARLQYDATFEKFTDIILFKQYGMFIECNSRYSPGTYLNTSGTVTSDRYVAVKYEDAKKSIKEININIDGSNTFAENTIINIYGVRANENQ